MWSCLSLWCRPPTPSSKGVWKLVCNIWLLLPGDRSPLLLTPRCSPFLSQHEIPWEIPISWGSFVSVTWLSTEGHNCPLQRSSFLPGRLQNGPEFFHSSPGSPTGQQLGTKTAAHSHTLPLLHGLLYKAIQGSRKRSFPHKLPSLRRLESAIEI